MELDATLFIQLAYALGAGALIGLERAMDQLDNGPASPAPPSPDTEDHDPVGSRPLADFIGVRTFSVLSLLGFASAVAADGWPWVPPVVLGSVGLLIVAMYRRSPRHAMGITSELAAMTTVVLGLLCHYHPKQAGVIALVLTVLLAGKRFSWHVVRNMRRIELTATLKFLVVVLIVLPLLPNEALDPYEAFNPFKVGLLVVLISGISFVGYFLTRILGAQRGLGLTGVLGGLTSSTAVTAAMAAEAREQPQLRSVCAFSTVIANATMFIRVLVVVGIISLDLVMRLAWSLGTMAVVALIASGALWLVASREPAVQTERSEVDLKNPFSIGPALKFAVFFVIILFVARLAQEFFGDAGLYAAATLSGLADVDAITLTITNQAQDGSLALDVAAIGITIAVVSNSLVKTVIALYSGGWRFGGLVGLCLGLATGAGLAVAVFM